MKKEFTKLTGITEAMFLEYCNDTSKNPRDKEVEKQFIKDVYDKKIVLKEGNLVYGL